MPDTELLSTALRPTGDRLVTPPLSDTARHRYRIVLQGACAYAYGGITFDARYRWSAPGEEPQRHRYLRWTPREPPLESEDLSQHRYVYRIPADWRLDGQSLGIQVDVDRFVEEYLVSPSDVRSALQGQIQFTMLQAPLAPPSPWPVVLWASIPTAVLAGGAGVIIRRRMALRGLDADLQEKLVQIARKHREARAVMQSASGPLFAVGHRLDEVKKGTEALIRQIQSLRDTRRLSDRSALLTDCAGMERRLATLDDPPARREGEAALEEKRKSLALLDELEKTEARCTLRLEKIVATMDTTCLTLRSVKLDTPDASAEEALRRELDSEVAAIREVTQEAAIWQSAH